MKNKKKKLNNVAAENDVRNQAMSLKDENNGIYWFEKDLEDI